jgi:hypothetical protein
VKYAAAVDVCSAAKFVPLDKPGDRTQWTDISGSAVVFAGRD